MKTIYLTGGRGHVTGTIAHMNPNYWIVITADGTEAKVPAHLIDYTRSA